MFGQSESPMMTTGSGTLEARVLAAFCCACAERDFEIADSRLAVLELIDRRRGTLPETEEAPLPGSGAEAAYRSIAGVSRRRRKPPRTSVLR